MINHTFGEVCGNSNAVVTEKTQLGVFRNGNGRFLESGKIKWRCSKLLGMLMVS